MKITKSQLLKIIHEEISEAVVDSPFSNPYQRTPAERDEIQRRIEKEQAKFAKTAAQFKIDREKPLDKSIERTLEDRVNRLETKLDTLIGMVQLNPGGASQKLRGPAGTHVELKEEKDEHQS